MHQVDSRGEAAPEVPFWYTRLGDAESAAVVEAIASQCLSQGALTAALETRLGSLLGIEHVVATTSGSMALYLAASALGIGPGDEVLLPDRTFMATAHAMMLTGARINLVDVEPGRTIIDTARIEGAITKRTKAIVPVHLNGQAADMAAIRAIAKKHGLFVIEDSAQAFASRSDGAYLGTQSNAGCFSLGVTKLITTGQGGFVVTAQPELASAMRVFRNHGVIDTFNTTYDRFGFNLKFTDIQAAIGLAQLGKLEAKIQAHRRVHEFYTNALRGLDYVVIRAVDSPESVPLWTEAFVDDPRMVVDLLAKRGIQIRPYLPSLHVSPYLGDFSDADFPNSNYFARHGIFLPSGPDMPHAFLHRVVAVFRELAPMMKPVALTSNGSRKLQTLHR